MYAAQGHAATGAPFSSYAALMWLAVLVLNTGFGSAAPLAAAIALVVIPGYVNSEAWLDWLPVIFGVGAVLVAMQEAARRPGASASKGETAAEAGDGRAGSRAAERAGSSGRDAERYQALVMAAARRASPPLVRAGARVVVSKGPRR